ncbi:peptidase M50 [Streptomyces mirabilis]|uniref:peptidase M50 n=1 Tax=Streptomyces mirabilis TaxID=68239 RepID=UPI003431C94E
MTGAPAASLLERRPARHPEVVLGPALRCGPRTVHLVRQRGTGRDYEVGPKEHFVLARLDGERTLADIGTAYAQTFGRRLGEDSWRQLLMLLAARALLAGGERRPDAASGRPMAGDRTGSAAGRPPAARPEEERRPNRLSGELVFGDPTPLLEWAHRRAGFLFSAWFLIPLLAALVTMEAVLALHSGEIWRHGTRALAAQPELAMLAFTLLWASTGLHELAHGLTCRHYGGRATEVGMRWNLPLVYMYCKADDVLFFPSRRPRVAAAAAGVIANLLFLLPFFALWLCLPPGDVTRDCVGAMLLIGSVKGLLNYLPLPQLDGYAMLCHALSTTRLSPETAGYLKLLTGHGEDVRRQRAAYPPHARAMYLGYAAVFLVCVTGLAAGATALVLAEIPAAHHTLALAVLGALFALMLAANLLRSRRRPAA